MRRRFAGLGLALALVAGCHKPPAPQQPQARVALWEISNSQGPRAWLFGTVHALPAGVRWRDGAIDRALASADQLVFEIAQPIERRRPAVLMMRAATATARTVSTIVKLVPVENAAPALRARSR